MQKSIKLMDTEVNPATTEDTTPAEVTVSQTPTKIQEYKQKLDAVCKEYNLFLNSTLVCTDCGSTNIGTEVRIMEGGAVAPAEPVETPQPDPSQPEATPEAAPQAVEETPVFPVEPEVIA